MIINHLVVLTMCPSVIDLVKCFCECKCFSHTCVTFLGSCYGNYGLVFVWDFGQGA